MTPRFFLASLAAVMAGCAVWVLACSSDDARPPPIAAFGCEDGGPSCGSGASTSTGTKDAAKPDSPTDADAAVATTTVKISVIRFLDTDLLEKQSFAYAGAALVWVQGATGEVPIGGDAGGELSADVLLGPSWFYVTPVGSPDFLKTRSYLNVLQDQTALKLPILDTQLLSSIYLQAGSSPLDATAGHIIVRFVDSFGTPVKGVRITKTPLTGPFSARLFDTGPGGSYVPAVGVGDAAPNTETGMLGTVIFTNVTDGIGSMTYTINSVEHQTPEIVWVPKQATFAVVVVPD